MRNEPRIVRQGDRGPDVLAYKITLRQLKYLDQRDRITNRFGDGMVGAVQAFQHDHGLTATGKIGEPTYDLLRPHMQEYPRHLIRKWVMEHEDRSFVLPIVHHEPALPGQFSVGTAAPARATLHDTESHDWAGIQDIMGVIGYWKTHPYDSGSLNGAHYIDDRDGFIAQIGTPRDILQHTGGANTGNIGIEQIGYARFGRALWLARPAQLAATAKILAYLHVKWEISLDVSTEHGVSTHAMQSRIHTESGGHTDPGVGYPFRTVRRMARTYVAAGGWVDHH